MIKFNQSYLKMFICSLLFAGTYRCTFFFLLFYWFIDWEKLLAAATANLLYFTTSLKLAKKSSQPKGRQLKTKKKCFNYLSSYKFMLHLFNLFCFIVFSKLYMTNKNNPDKFYLVQRVINQIKSKYISKQLLYNYFQNKTFTWLNMVSFSDVKELNKD